MDVENDKRGVRPVSRVPQRADAVANRAKVVAAARAAFAEGGLEASLDGIARRAGVGAGTVHRHFATKADLVDAVLAAMVTDLVAVAESYDESDDPGDSLRAFLVHLVTAGAAAHELAARLRTGGGDVDAAVREPTVELGRATAALLSRARDAGAVGEDIGEGDLAAIVAAAHAAYVHPEGGERAVALVLRALD